MKSNLTLLAILLLLGTLMFAAGCNGPRLCPGAVDCQRLQELTCGADDQCAASKSCLAAIRLSKKDNPDFCQTAWCDLGSTYRECGGF